MRWQRAIFSVGLCIHRQHCAVNWIKVGKIIRHLRLPQFAVRHLAAVLCFGRPRPVRSGKPPGAAAQEAPGAAGEKAAAAGESRGGKNRRTLAGAQPRVKGLSENFLRGQAGFGGFCQTRLDYPMPLPGTLGRPRRFLCCSTPGGFPYLAGRDRPGPAKTKLLDWKGA